MKKRVINKIIIYTMIIFCMSVFSCFPKSYSKYIKDEIPAKFNVNLSSIVYEEELDTIAFASGSTYETAHYTFGFKRGNDWNSNTNDEREHIYVKIEQACEITGVISKGTNTYSGNTATITYSSSGEDYITVKFKCNVETIKKTISNEDSVYVNINVYEKFEPENVEYFYANDSSIMTLDKYYSLYHKPVVEGNRLILPSAYVGKYEAFESWIKSYADKAGYSEEIIAYVKSVYTNETDITGLNKSLEGLTVTEDLVNNQYIYEIDNNFTGYARTYYSRMTLNKLARVAFSNSGADDAEINRIFKDYLQTYGTNTYTPDDVETIMSYVSSFGSLNHIIKANNTILGFTYLPDTNEVRISPSLLDYAKSYLAQEIIISFDIGFNMFDVYWLALPNTYSFITDDLYHTLSYDSSIQASVMKNNTSNTQVAYSDYFAVQDTITKKYVLLNVYSDGLTNTHAKVIELEDEYTVLQDPITLEQVLIHMYTDSESNIKAEVIKLGVAESFNISEVDNKIDISMYLNNDDTSVAMANVTNIITNLDDHFKTEYNKEIVLELFKTSTTIGNITSVVEGNKVTISYTITE